MNRLLATLLVGLCRSFLVWRLLSTVFTFWFCFFVFVFYFTFWFIFSFPILFLVYSSFKNNGFVFIVIRHQQEGVIAFGGGRRFRRSRYRWKVNPLSGFRRYQDRRRWCQPPKVRNTYFCMFCLLPFSLFL